MCKTRSLILTEKWLLLLKIEIVMKYYSTKICALFNDYHLSPANKIIYVFVFVCVYFKVTYHHIGK